MDERLEKALNFSNYIVTLNNQKNLLKEKLDQRLVHYYGGGTFTVTTELVTFVGMLVSRDRTSFVLLDDNSMPIKVEDLPTFLDDILDILESSLLDYHKDYQEMKSKRSVESLVNYE